MKIFTQIRFALIGLCLFAALGLSAQMEMPRKSIKASVSYHVGLTTVNVDYSAPAARGRELWGGVVPYDKVWRAGANEATIITFDTEVVLGSKMVPAGSYSLFLIPRKKGSWTAIFNKNTRLWGESDYKEAEDLVRLPVTARQVRTYDERLTYSVTDNGIDAGSIRLSWGNTQVDIPFQVRLEEQLQAAINRALEQYSDDEDYQAYGQAADFLMTSRNHLSQAMAFVDRSLNMFRHSWNVWIKAQIYAEMGNFKQAVATAREAMEIGAREEDGYFPLVKGLMEKAVKEWGKAKG